MLGSSHPFAESVNESNSDKSDDDDDLGSSRRDDADQDSILDSVSSDEDESKASAFEVESEWSEADHIFSVDFDEVYD